MLHRSCRTVVLAVMYRSPSAFAKTGFVVSSRRLASCTEWTSQGAASSQDRRSLRQQTLRQLHMQAKSA